jgi:thiol-disulfide isomerase/thioredoxin
MWMMRFAKRWMAMAACLAIPVAAGAQSKDYGKMPAFAAKDALGHSIRSSKLAGKVLVVDLWASWCPPCKLEVPGLMDLQKKYAGKGLQVIGFSADYDPKTHKDWVVQHKLNYPSIYVNDPAGEKILARFSKRVGAIQGYPTTLFIDRKGEIVYLHLGYAQEAQFDKILAPLLAQKS